MAAQTNSAGRGTEGTAFKKLRIIFICLEGGGGESGCVGGRWAYSTGPSVAEAC